MKHRLLRLLFLFVMLVMSASCGRTIYRAKYTKSKKFTRSEKRYYFWHKHGARPRAHYGGWY